jgi:hypothetical protein
MFVLILISNSSTQLFVAYDAEGGTYELSVPADSAMKTRCYQILPELILSRVSTAETLLEAKLKF